MAQCECLEKCIFFHDKMGNMPSMAEIMKKKYCLGDSNNCARHIVFKAKGKGSVPADLFPNQLDRAEKLIHG
ncbi:MAG: hypothetical protein JXX14_07035 [Deltaproteobacteria bacterium]|nr:hypothetical protein [Deltaproteobacteria bacterium]